MLDSIVSSLQEPPTLAEAIEPFAGLSIGSTATGGIVTVNSAALDSTVSSVPTGTSVPVTDLLVGSTTSVVAAVTPRTTVAPTPGTTVPPTPGTTVPPTSVQSVYNIPSVGIITLKHDSISLKIVSVNPDSGWTFTAENTYPARVEVEFENNNQSVVFRAELIDGRVVAAVSADDGGDSDDATKDAETAAKIAADAAEQLAKATYDATVTAAKTTYDADEKAAKATYDADEKAAKATYDADETAAKEASDEDAETAAKNAYENAMTTIKNAYESAMTAIKAAYEAAMTAAKAAYESADD